MKHDVSSTGAKMRLQNWAILQNTPIPIPETNKITYHNRPNKTYSLDIYHLNLTGKEHNGPISQIHFCVSNTI